MRASPYLEAQNKCRIKLLHKLLQIAFEPVRRDRYYSGLHLNEKTAGK